MPDQPPAPPPTGLPPCGGGAGDDAVGVSRRTFIGASAGGAAGLSLAAAATAGAATPGSPDADGPDAGGEHAARFSFTLNGEERAFALDPRVSLLDLLRERLGLTGTKKGCDHGACGACTVHVARPGDGTEGPTRQLACLTLAATLDGAAVTTIEGLPASVGKGGDELHPVQEAFLRCDAYQCGYCTPGQIMSAAALLTEDAARGGRAGSREAVREWMSGNLCRCAAYPNIVAAVRQAAGEEEPADPSAAAVILPPDAHADGEG